MVYHFFNSNQSHLTVGITSTILRNFDKNNHFFIFIGDDFAKWRLHKEKFETFSFFNYVFFSNISDFVKKRKNVVKRDDVLLLHSGNYRLMLVLILLRYKHINWICWGSGCSINNNWKSKLSSVLKKWMYSHFDSSVALMCADKDSLIKEFRLANVFHIPYISSRFPFSLEHLSTNNSNDSVQIYLGNNTFSIPSYIVLLEKLLPYKNVVSNLLCMVNYSLDENNIQYKILLNKGNKLWGSKFHADTNFYIDDNYYYYIDKCDVYICSIESQTGLGVIYTCLRLGKKVFLAGRNYAYIKQLGCTVFHCNDLDRNDLNLLISPLSYEERLHNFEVISNHVDTKVQWNSYFSFITSK